MENHSKLNFSNPNELIIQTDLAKQIIGLGDEGAAVILTGKAKERGDAQLKEISINVELSEQLSYNRTVPDVRNLLCRHKKYNLSTLPTTSVVIIYYNEPYSVILRTVHSVLRTTNEHILKEIILVDDASTDIELKGKLSYYVQTRLPRIVKIIILNERQGLISARLAGARAASGDILVFLDAHCECNIEWLEPLADRIRESRTSVLLPIIDGISMYTFQYMANRVYNNEFQIGGFSWNGHYIWINIPKFEKDRIKRECPYKPEICPTYSPTMAGGLFAINRQYFWKIGGYDDKMEGWGGENLEMSFRIWQCGGTIEAIPCSRIGHIYKKFKHFDLPNNKDTHGINTFRMAKVWMDEYIELFFMNRPEFKNNNTFGDVGERKLLRKQLKCKDFNWYLENIYPQKMIPTKNVQGYGQFRSNKMCLDNLQQDSASSFKLGVYRCYPEVVRSQFISLTNNGVLRTEDFCSVLVKNNTKNRYEVEMIRCGNYHKELWIYSKDGNFKHLKSGLCLDSNGLNDGDFVQVDKCNTQSETQKWFFHH